MLGSLRGPLLRRRRRRRAEARVALVSGVDEEARLFDELVRRLEARRLAAIFVRPEEVLRELPARERIEEELRVVEVLPELGHDLVGLGADVREALAGERARRPQIRREGARRRIAVRLLVEEDLRLEELSLR